METLLLRLLDYLKFQAMTDDGRAFVVRLKPDYDEDNLLRPIHEDCEFLDHNRPLWLVNYPGVPTQAELAKLVPDPKKTPWLVVLHAEDQAMVIPVNSYTGRI